jgi:hypothetical protein
MAGFDSLFVSKEKILEKVVEIVCADFIVPNATVCEGAVSEMGDVIVPVISNSLLKPDYFCSEFAGMCDTPYYMFFAEQWVEDLLKTKPSQIQENNYLNGVYETVKASNGPRKILRAIQLTDPHIDWLYAPGADSHCNMPICCRASNGFPTD